MHLNNTIEHHHAKILVSALIGRQVSNVTLHTPQNQASTAIVLR